MISKILIASNNPSKIEKFRVIFKDLGIRVYSPKELKIKENHKEDGKSEKENAFLKAKAYFRKVDFPILGDDAGLYMDALNGEPGFRARRWGDRFPEDISDEEWMRYFISRMEKVPEEKRTGYFKWVWCLLLPDGRTKYKEGKDKFIVKLEHYIPGKYKGWPLHSVIFDTETGQRLHDSSNSVVHKGHKEIMKKWLKELSII